jgi:iron complex outermembrane receptor protein
MILKTPACSIFTTILLSSLAPPILAQEEATGETRPIVVTGQPEALTQPSIDTARTQLDDVAGGTDVVDAEDYRRGRSAIFQDVFQMAPGVYAPARGSEGDEVKLSIRGSGLDLGFHLRGIKLLQDGVPVSFADGFADFQEIDPLSLRYVEIWRGANALRYGATTLGGAINFVSPTGYDASKLQLRFEGGSFDYFNGQASSGGVFGAADYYVSLTGASREGFQEHTDMRSWRLFANLGYRINDDLETRFYLGLVRSRTALPGNLTKDEIENSPNAADPDAIAFDQRRDVDWVRLANRTVWRIDQTQRLEAALYYSYLDLHHPLFWNPFFLNGLGVLEDTYNDFGGEVRYLNGADWFGGENRLTIGFAPHATLLHDDRLQNLNGRSGAKVADGDFAAVNYDFYAENQHYFTNKFSVVTGASLSYAVRNFQDNFKSDPNGDQSRDQDYLGFSPKLGVIYEPNEHIQLFANVSRSFEPASSVELIALGGPAGDILSSKLDAQTATTIEVGTRGEVDRFRWEFSYYHSWVEDELLTLNDQFGNPLGTVNGPHTIHQGIELGLDVKLLEEILCPANASSEQLDRDRLTLRQVFNWNDFRFDRSDVYGDNRLAGAPELTYRAELLYESPCGFYFAPNVQAASRVPADYANTLLGNSYAVLGVNFGYRSAIGWSVFADFRNLTNERYASAAEPIADATTSFGAPRVFHPGEPRSFYAGIEWKW